MPPSSDTLMWCNYENGNAVKYHLKDEGHAAACSYNPYDPGHWSIGTNVPPNSPDVTCSACAQVAENMIDPLTGQYDPRLEMIMLGFENKVQQLQSQGKSISRAFGMKTKPEGGRNISPFAQIEKNNTAAETVIEKIEAGTFTQENLETFKKQVRKSKDWILAELFTETCALPYNMGAE